MDSQLVLILVAILVLVIIMVLYFSFCPTYENNDQLKCCYRKKDIKYLLKDSDVNISEDKIVNYVKARKFNFTQKVNVDAKGDELTVLSDTPFRMFQIWSPLHARLNEDRILSLRIKQNDMNNLIQNAKKELNFEPTIFLHCDDEYFFNVCQRSEYKDGKLTLKLKYPFEEQLRNKTVILYIDSTTSGSCQGQTCSGTGVKTVCDTVCVSSIPFDDST